MASLVLQHFKVPGARDTDMQVKLEVSRGFKTQTLLLSREPMTIVSVALERQTSHSSLALLLFLAQLKCQLKSR